MRLVRARHRALLAAALLGLTACTGSQAQPQPTHSVSVFAAASLAGAFRAIGADFTRANPSTHVDFNFAGSSTLVTQIQQGAPADVFASADQVSMQKLVDSRLVIGSPQVFATNQLQIVVQAGNPKGITRLQDLARPGLVVVLCGYTVPCGRYSGQALLKAGVRLTPASLEADVKAVVSKVALGEADAGLVYVTDIKAGTGVQGVSIPPDQNVVATYPIAVLTGAHDAGASRAFVDFVLSSQAQGILASFGFAGP